MSTALARYESETRNTMARFECSREINRPVIAGPKNPPRFPAELMNPMEAARDDRALASVGRTQNAGFQAKTEAPVRQSQTSSRALGWPGIAVNAKNIAAAIMGTAACTLRSPVRSDERPVIHVDNIASPKGNAERAS